MPKYEDVLKELGRPLDVAPVSQPGMGQHRVICPKCGCEFPIRLIIQGIRVGVQFPQRVKT